MTTCSALCMHYGLNSGDDLFSDEKLVLWHHRHRKKSHKWGKKIWIYVLWSEFRTITCYYLKNLQVQRHCIMHHWTTSWNGTRLRYHMPSSPKVVVKNVNRQSSLSLFKIKQGHKYSKKKQQSHTSKCMTGLLNNTSKGLSIKGGCCQARGLSNRMILSQWLSISTSNVVS